MKNNHITITVCLSLFEPYEYINSIKKKLSEQYQTNNIAVISGLGFNQIAITNELTNETTLLNPKHD
jgi:hypothetical protein